MKFCQLLLLFLLVVDVDIQSDYGSTIAVKSNRLFDFRDQNLSNR